MKSSTQRTRIGCSRSSIGHAREQRVPRAAAAAEMIRGGEASFDGRYGPALLAAIDNLERTSMVLLSPELMAVQRALRALL